ncbi:MAG: hypothetical protein ACK4OP_01510 [Gemmobacter sp.]
MPPLTYPAGWNAVIEQWEARRAPLTTRPGEQGLPPADIDLVPLRDVLVPGAPEPPAPPVSSFARKRHALTEEFAGQSELALLNALVVACLRRRAWPAQAPVLFRRIWWEQSAVMTATLNTRWLVSSAVTFADHGETEGERYLGQSIRMLFKLVKLYEFERLYSGVPPDQPFRLGRKVQAPLPMEINPFALRDGGLDVNLLAPLWKQALDEPVLGPLACVLFDRLNADPGTVLRRLALMREKLRARNAERG